ncbi:MAG: hypothetical protein QG607_339 [Patescibacteria group bacterium]|nr:hypothetical protein [Patescibacteria group bacterium]
MPEQIIGQPKTPESAEPKSMEGHVDVVKLSDRIRAIDLNLDAKEKEDMVISYQAKLKKAQEDGKPTAFYETMIAKYSKPSELISANESAIGKIQSEISKLFNAPYSIYQGGHELQAANNAISYETSALRQAKMGENPDVDGPAAEARLLAAQKRYIEALKSMKAEKEAILNKVGEADNTIKEGQIATAAEKKSPSENGDPRTTLEVRMAYQDALKALNGKTVPTELTALRLAVDDMYEETEEKKRGPMLAFLNAYKLYNQTLN